MNNRFWVVATVSLLLIGARLSSADGINLLRNGDFSQELQSWKLQLKTPDNASIEKVNGMSFARALTLDTEEEPGVLLQQGINAAFKKGEPVTLKLWLRGDADATPISKAIASIQAADARVKQSPLTLTPQWQEFSISGTAPRDFKPEELSCALSFSPDAGKVRIAALRFFKGEGSTSVAITSAPAPEPSKPLGQYQVSGPANPHLPPSGGSFSKPHDSSFTEVINSGSFTNPATAPVNPPIAPPTVASSTPAKPVPAKPAPTKPAPTKPAAPVAFPLAANPAGIYAPISNPIAELPLAPAANTPGYMASATPGFQKLPLTNHLVEVMPPDACGLLQNSDFEHNKMTGGIDYQYKRFGAWLVPKDTNQIQAEVVPAQAGPYGSALRLNSTPPGGAKSFMLTVMQHTMTPPVLSDALVLRVWMRSPDKTCISVRVEQHQPCRRIIEETIYLKPQWKEYTFRGGRTTGGPMDRAYVKFQLGSCPGVIEITGVCLTIEGRSSVR